jgi:aminomethyltransferase
MTDLTTPLHAWHVARGANMAAFGGYDMPLWYSSAKNEHLSVLRTAGLFDTSHMAIVQVAGAGACDLLQRAFTNDLAGCIGPARKPLVPGRAVYGAFLDSQGHVVDDSIIFMQAEDNYLAVVNAGMGPAVARHLDALAGGHEATVKDLSGRFGKIDVQGPQAARIMARVLADPAAAFQKLPYFAFKGRFDARHPAPGEVLLTSGHPILLSRTGYTGEFGFEIFTPPDALVAIWENILTAGEDAGALPCGLAARDSLRAGAVLPLSHQDIGDWPFINHPWPFALPFTGSGEGFRKSFEGDRALLAAADAPHTQAFVGRDLRKVMAPARVLDGAGREIGDVLTCVTDMAIGRVDGRIYSVASPDAPEGFQAKGLACGFVRLARPLPAGTALELQDQRRRIPVRIVDDIRPDRTARRPLTAFWKE